MKKLFPLLLTLLLISSCEDSIEVTTTTNINESASVTILETNGTAINFNEVIEGDLNQLVSNFNSINDITIDSLSYTFANVTGNENAVITSATIEINATTVAVISNIKFDVSIIKTQAILSTGCPRSSGKNNPTSNEKNPPDKRYPDSGSVGGIVEIEVDSAFSGR